MIEPLNMYEDLTVDREGVNVADLIPEDAKQPDIIMGFDQNTAAEVTTTSVSANVEVAEGSSYSAQDIMDILKSIEEVNESFEMYRNIAESKERMQWACNQIGIGRKDQEIIHAKMKETGYTQEEMDKVIHDKERMDKEFFTRPDGSVIKPRKLQGYTDLKLKQELISYIYAFYLMDNEADKEIRSVQEESKEVTSAGVEVLTDHIANTFVRDIQRNKEKFIEDETIENREKEIDRCNALLAAFTLEDIDEVFDKYPKVISSTVESYKSEREVSRIAEAYHKRRVDLKVGSNLIACISKEADKSIEARFLNPDQWVKGYEDLFGFYLLKHYGRRNWKEGFIREQHNAMVVLLRALIEDRMNQDVRDEFVSNIARIWSYFRDEINKK